MYREYIEKRDRIPISRHTNEDNREYAKWNDIEDL